MIRPSRHDEASFLTELAVRSKAHWGYSDDFMRLCREELTITTGYLDEHTCFVLEADGEADGHAVGFVTLERLTDADARVELGHLFVEPSCIGRGYGRELMTHAVEAARDAGYRVLEIQADPNAEKFYLAAGARRIGSKPSTSIPGRELPLMEFELQPRP